jgi:hypothetical protein
MLSFETVSPRLETRRCRIQVTHYLSANICILRLMWFLLVWLLWPFFSSTTYTTAAYGSNPNVFIRLDSIGRTGSVGSGSYATIASFHKLPLPLSRRSSPSPCPYATTNIGSATYIASTNGSGRYSHHIYSKPASTYCPSRVSYYASSQLTHLSQVNVCTAVTFTPRSWVIWQYRDPYRSRVSEHAFCQKTELLLLCKLMKLGHRDPDVCEV